MDFIELAENDTVIFGDSWTDLYRVSIYKGVPYWPAESAFLPGIGVEVDNIVVNVVPIPAAAWLFGSALAGLAFLRRKAVS